MPLDFEPREDGNVVLELGSNGRLLATVLGPLELMLLEADRLRFMPHHATCPDAAQWKGPSS